jgi:hypothetical protein
MTLPSYRFIPGFMFKPKGLSAKKGLLVPYGSTLTKVREDIFAKRGSGKRSNSIVSEVYVLLDKLYNKNKSKNVNYFKFFLILFLFTFYQTPLKPPSSIGGE